MNTTIMDRLKDEISYVVSLGFSSNWLGETSSAYNGGGVNFSDTFVAGYLWLDKLGISALHGLDVVVRQELFGSYQIGAISSYCLLNMMMVPTPVCLCLQFVAQIESFQMSGRWGHKLLSV